MPSKFIDLCELYEKNPRRVTQAMKDEEDKIKKLRSRKTESEVNHKKEQAYERAAEREVLMF